MTVNFAPFQPSPYESERLKITTLVFLSMPSPTASTPLSAERVNVTGSCSVVGHDSSTVMLKINEPTPEASIVPTSTVLFSNER